MSQENHPPQKEITIERTSREVIENVLLARLSDTSSVAILLNREDLMLMIEALRYYQAATGDPTVKEMAADFAKLLQSAFPKSTD